MSFDMEGVAGIVDWEQCRPSGGVRYDIGCRLLLDEVNAAGAVGPPGDHPPGAPRARRADRGHGRGGHWVRGTERAGERTVRIEGEDLLDVFRSFVAVLHHPPGRRPLTHVPLRANAFASCR